MDALVLRTMVDVRERYLSGVYDIVCQTMRVVVCIHTLQAVGDACARWTSQ